MPSEILGNDELAEVLGIEASWISERTGIDSRRIAGAEQSTVTLATDACAAALQQAELDAKNIDHVIIATATADERLPAAASVVQHVLGAHGAGAFDLNAGCAGFLYALAAGDALITAGTARRVLVCGADVLARFTDYNDPKSCVLFGDGAGAVVLEHIEGLSRLGPFRLHSDGSGAPLLHIPVAGLIEMQGREVYRWAVAKMTESIAEVTAAAGLGAGDIDLLVGHQANARILDAVAERSGLGEQSLVNIARWGNTSAASIPIALAEAHATGRLRDDDTVVLTAFGAGFVWGAGVVRWGLGATPSVTELAGSLAHA